MPCNLITLERVLRTGDWLQFLWVIGDEDGLPFAHGARNKYFTGQCACIPHEQMRSARDPPLMATAFPPKCVIPPVKIMIGWTLYFLSNGIYNCGKFRSTCLAKFAS